MPASAAESIASRLAQDPLVNPTGLGARDSLRLEAGLCLYGNDLDDSTTPVEAGLAWTMGPPKGRRRLEQGFLGADKILQPDGKLQPVARKRVGILGHKAPARDHTDIYNATGDVKIGQVTSGTYGPSVKAPVAMGYVETASSAAGTPVMLQIRNKMVPAEIAKMPFVKPGYYKVPE
jgi:aminomethyltransferase